MPRYVGEVSLRRCFFGDLPSARLERFTHTRSRVLPRENMGERTNLHRGRKTSEMPIVLDITV